MSETEKAEQAGKESKEEEKKDPKSDQNASSGSDKILGFLEELKNGIIAKFSTWFFLSSIVLSFYIIILILSMNEPKVCINEDDFGQILKYRLNARNIIYSGIPAASSYKSTGQASLWIDTGFVTNGKDLEITSYGEWFPWGKGLTPRNRKIKYIHKQQDGNSSYSPSLEEDYVQCLFNTDIPPAIANSNFLKTLYNTYTFSIQKNKYYLKTGDITNETNGKPIETASGYNYDVLFQYAVNHLKRYSKNFQETFYNTDILQQTSIIENNEIISNNSSVMSDCISGVNCTFQDILNGQSSPCSLTRGQGVYMKIGDYTMNGREVKYAFHIANHLAPRIKKNCTDDLTKTPNERKCAYQFEKDNYGNIIFQSIPFTLPLKVYDWNRDVNYDIEDIRNEEIPLIYATNDSSTRYSDGLNVSDYLFTRHRVDEGNTDCNDLDFFDKSNGTCYKAVTAKWNYNFNNSTGSAERQEQKVCIFDYLRSKNANPEHPSEICSPAPDQKIYLKLSTTNYALAEGEVTVVFKKGVKRNINGQSLNFIEEILYKSIAPFWGTQSNDKKISSLVTKDSSGRGMIFDNSGAEKSLTINFSTPIIVTVKNGDLFLNEAILSPKIKKIINKENSAHIAMYNPVDSSFLMQSNDWLDYTFNQVSNNFNQLTLTPKRICTEEEVLSKNTNKCGKARYDFFQQNGYDFFDEFSLNSQNIKLEDISVKSSSFLEISNMESGIFVQIRNFILDMTLFQQLRFVLLIWTLLFYGYDILIGKRQISFTSMKSDFIRFYFLIFLTDKQNYYFIDEIVIPFFVNGIITLSEILLSAASWIMGTSIDFDNPFDFFNGFLTMFLSREFFYKIISISMSNTVFLFFIIFPFFMISVIEIFKVIIGNIFFLIFGILNMGVLLMFLPFFVAISFLESRKSAFQNWLNIWKSEFLNLTISISIFGLFFGIVARQLFDILRFQTCFETWFLFGQGLFALPLNGWVSKSTLSTTQLFYKLFALYLLSSMLQKVSGLATSIATNIVGGGKYMNMQSSNQFFSEIIDSASAAIDKFLEKPPEKAPQDLQGADKEALKSIGDNLRKDAKGLSKKERDIFNKAVEQDLKKGGKDSKQLQELMKQPKAKTPEEERKREEQKKQLMAKILKENSNDPEAKKLIAKLNNKNFSLKEGMKKETKENAKDGKKKGKKNKKGAVDGKKGSREGGIEDSKNKNKTANRAGSENLGSDSKKGSREGGFGNPGDKNKTANRAGFQNLSNDVKKGSREGGFENINTKGGATIRRGLPTDDLNSKKTTLTDKNIFLLKERKGLDAEKTIILKKNENGLFTGTQSIENKTINGPQSITRKLSDAEVKKYQNRINLAENKKTITTNLKSQFNSFQKESTSSQSESDLLWNKNVLSVNRAITESKLKEEALKKDITNVEKTLLNKNNIDEKNIGKNEAGIDEKSKDNLATVDRAITQNTENIKEEILKKDILNAEKILNTENKKDNEVLLNKNIIDGKNIGNDEAGIDEKSKDNLATVDRAITENTENIKEKELQKSNNDSNLLSAKKLPDNKIIKDNKNKNAIKKNIDNKSKIRLTDEEIKQKREERAIKRGINEANSIFGDGLDSVRDKVGNKTKEVVAVEGLLGQMFSEIGSMIAEAVKDSLARAYEDITGFDSNKTLGENIAEKLTEVKKNTFGSLLDEDGNFKNSKELGQDFKDSIKNIALVKNFSDLASAPSEFQGAMDKIHKYQDDEKKVLDSGKLVLNNNIEDIDKKIAANKAFLAENETFKKPELISADDLAKSKELDKNKTSEDKAFDGMGSMFQEAESQNSTREVKIEEIKKLEKEKSEALAQIKELEKKEEKLSTGSIFGGAIGSLIFDQKYEEGKGFGEYLSDFATQQANKMVDHVTNEFKKTIVYKGYDNVVNFRENTEKYFNELGKEIDVYGKSIEKEWTERLSFLGTKDDPLNLNSFSKEWNESQNSYVWSKEEAEKMNKVIKQNRFKLQELGFTKEGIDNYEQNMKIADKEIEKMKEKGSSNEEIDRYKKSIYYDVTNEYKLNKENYMGNLFSEDLPEDKKQPTEYLDKISPSKDLSDFSKIDNTFGNKKYEFDEQSKSNAADFIEKKINSFENQENIEKTFKETITEIKESWDEKPPMKTPDDSSGGGYIPQEETFTKEFNYEKLKDPEPLGGSYSPKEEPVNLTESEGVTAQVGTEGATNELKTEGLNDVTTVEAPQMEFSATYQEPKQEEGQEERDDQKKEKQEESQEKMEKFKEKMEQLEEVKHQKKK